MTSIFFVRHAQPDIAWEDDRTRPLTDVGLEDSKIVTAVLE
ncbi:MAG: histidine phosphatase family protein, partial [Firmicutes bacterium]|nr:histidine phosphatase family protein [Bacillota bacterium]